MTNEKYESKLAFVSKEDLSPKERVKLMVGGDAIKLDDIVQPNEPFTLELDYYAYIQVHNPKSENPDYTRILLVDRGGTIYSTSSDSFQGRLDQMEETLKELGEALNGCDLRCYKGESKNRPGKHFLTCTLE